MITITIDDKPYQIEDKGQNLLEACLSLKLNLPYFCWHPALRSAGACRQCAVTLFKDADDKKGRLAMACVTPVRDGLRASIQDPQAVAFRAHVIEWLMANHPHDCPVCDEGGECHLQDMTVMTGHTCRRYRFPKRTFKNQDLGPFVSQEMNRCIDCYRCVRFYRDYAGGRDFNVFGWNNRLFFGRHEDGPLESPFSGNLVEVCPTGAFTDKTFKNHPVRKWDLASAPSVCPHCCLGCNTFPAERDGMVRRVQNRYNPLVNGYFLCDRGRFGYEYVNSPKRLSEPCVKNSSHKLEPTTLEKALQAIPKENLVGIGSPRASIENNFALRALVGAENFYHGVSEQEFAATQTIIGILSEMPEQIASLQDAENSDAVFILGEDPTTTAPRLSLSLRQAVLVQPKAANAAHIAEWDTAGMREVIQEARGPLFIATVAKTHLDDVATDVYFAAPDDIARLGFQVAHELDPSAPAPFDLADAIKEKAHQIAEALRSAHHPLIVSGSLLGSLETIQAAANIARALHTTRLLYTLPCCNSFGLGLMGGESLEALFNRKIETLIILESDLYRHLDSARVQDLLSRTGRVIVLDSVITQTTTAADVLIPVPAITEDIGTFVNFEGRAQRFFKIVHKEALCPAWQVFSQSTFDDLWKKISDEIPSLASASKLTPDASFRVIGQKIPREASRWSGRTSLHVNQELHEQKPPDDKDSPLAFSMEGTQNPPPSLVSRYWAPGWNSVQAVHEFEHTPPTVRCTSPDVTHRGYFNRIPPPFHRRPGEWLVLPSFPIFGFEELSSMSPSIMSLSLQPCLTINSSHAEQLGLKEGQKVHLSFQIDEITLHLDPQIAEGIALMTGSLPSTSAAWGTIRP